MDSLVGFVVVAAVSFFVVVIGFFLLVLYSICAVL